MGKLKFGKIYDDIYTSSVCADPLVRLVFMDFIVLSDADGMMPMTIDAFAHKTRVDLKVIEDAIAKLSTPDPQSWSQEYEGRRLVPLEGAARGYLVVNKRKYWDKRGTISDTKEAARLRKQAQREREKKATVKHPKSEEPGPEAAEPPPLGGALPKKGGVVMRLADDKHIELGAGKIAEWGEQFPDMDVPKELEKLQAFLDYKDGHGLNYKTIWGYCVTWFLRGFNKDEYVKKDGILYTPTDDDLDPHNPAHDGYEYPDNLFVWSSLAGKKVPKEEYEPDPKGPKANTDTAAESLDGGLV